MPVLRRQYRLNVVNAELFEELSPPYVVVANHSTFYDGFFLAGGIRGRIYMLVTDSVLHGALGALIKRAGVVPMTKNLINVDSVRGMLSLVKRGKVIGIFPEGQTTWHGASGPIYPAVGKLVKLLGVPLVSAIMKGGYHTEPKWSREKRDGSITVEYKLVAGAEEIAARTAAELTEMVQSAITHDDFAYIHDNGLSFPSKRGAEYLERVLYHCPECDALASLRSRDNTLRCGSCGAEWLWAGRGILHRQSDDRAANTAEPVTIREWTERQKAALDRILRTRLAEQDERPLYPPDEVIAWKGYRTARRTRLGKGLLCVTPEAYVFESPKHGRLVFPMSELSACQVMEANQFEFYFGGNIYVFGFAHPATSGFKYINVLQIRNPDAAEVI
ncbi:MAG: 1-acyl-sn-glycerol-3-phosphate acyltransferase [Spirochaetales bacterium]|nr:1-acyl-sn-glycerol-3-phosphate acyltransferase [Spirochaetales bacterium]